MAKTINGTLEIRSRLIPDGPRVKYGQWHVLKDPLTHEVRAYRSLPNGNVLIRQGSNMETWERPQAAEIFRELRAKGWLRR